jgi:signal peptidase I
MNWRYIKRALLATSLLIAVGAGGSFAIAQFHGNKMLSVQSGSMVPVLHKGDLVSVNPVPDSKLKVGDVITYIKPSNANQTVTHRIIQLPNLSNQHRYIVKGDANASADPAVPANKIVGRVGYHVPYVGFLIDLLHKPIGLAILIWFPALVIVIGETQKLSKQYSRSKPYISSLMKGRRPPKEKGIGKTPLIAAQSVLALVFFSIFLALPVYALLTSKATLTDTSIATAPIVVPPVEGPHVTFRSVTLRCSSDNTLSSSKRPLIIVQNWTHANVVTHGWKIADNSGTIITIPDGFVLKKLHQYRFTPLLSNGLQYAGDRLVLTNDIGQSVDALSWGTDTTAFTPNIPAVASGSKLDRRPFNVDTDKASDWRVANHTCHCPLSPEIEAGDDGGELGDQDETNRVTTFGAFNLEEI